MERSLQQIVDAADSIVVVQADNPDGDSLASSLALEQLLSEMGKQVFLYCGVPIPGYLRYMEGWDRVSPELPHQFDASIIVDTSALILLEQLHKTGEISWIKTKPCIVLDHHTATDPTIDFAALTYIRPAVSTGELIYELARANEWKVGVNAGEFIMMSIMSDSLGLTSESTTSQSIHIVSELVELGVSIPKLENQRRAMQKKSPELLKYKGELIKRVDYSPDGRIAHITIPWEEIEKYSHEYNPSVLVLDEMRMVTSVAIAIAFKTYPDGRITAKLRANYGFGIAAELASRFGGGGHPYAAGFKITDGKPFNEIKSECIQKAEALLDTLKAQDTQNETTKYTYTVD
jgi:bifunctional oligoribonuclease and PAP phosphatase NrnA